MGQLEHAFAPMRVVEKESRQASRGRSAPYHRGGGTILFCVTLFRKMASVEATATGPGYEPVGQTSFMKNVQNTAFTVQCDLASKNSYSRFSYRRDQ